MSPFWRRSPDQEVTEDLDFHLAMARKELEASGYSPEDAAAEAHRRFGDYQRVHSQCREIAADRDRIWAWSNWHHGVMQDLRSGWRQLWRRPGFSVLAIAMIALGVGGTSAIFGIVNGILLKPLSLPEPDRVVLVCEGNATSGDWCGASPPNALDWARNSRTLQTIGLARSWPMTLQDGEKTERIAAGLATPDFFRVAGVAPLLGRLFMPEDQQGVGAAVALVGHEYWQSRFGADPDLVGRSVTIDGQSVTVVGVLPEGFEVPLLDWVQFWRPLHIDPADEEHRDWRGFLAYARLTDGASVSQAEQELTTIGQALVAQHPETNEGWTLRVETLRHRVVGSVEPMLLLFLGSVFFVLLIGCANVANLLLVRATERQAEVAVRASLGAGRARLVRLLLVESMVLAMLGGVAGIAIALGASQLFLSLAPPGIPRIDEVAFDLPVTVFALLLSLATAVVFGLAPALIAARTDLSQSLKSSARVAGSRSGLRQVLVTVEVALATMLLVGAGLMTRSFLNLEAWDPGFERDGILTSWTFMPPGRYPQIEQVIESYHLAVADLKSVPGIKAVAMASAGPMFGGREPGEVIVESNPAPVGQRPTLRWFDVSPGYFRLLGIPVVRGRGLTEADRRGMPRVAVINQTAASLLFGSSSPLGERLTMTLHGMSVEVVGVVSDVPPLSPDQAPDPEIYWPFDQVPRWASYILVRTDGDPAEAAGLLTTRLESSVPGIQVSQPETLTQLLDEELVTPRFTMWLVGAFAFMALLLAVGGVYGVIAFTVAARYRELAIRVALGAGSRRVLGLVLRQGLPPVVAGALLGTASAVAMAGLLSGLLYGVSGGDPGTLVAVTGLMFGIATLAALLPARRTLRLNPAQALRAE